MGLDTDYHNKELIQQMSDCFGDDLESINMQFIQLERIIKKVRVSLDNMIKEKHIRKFSIYNVNVDSTNAAKVVVSDKGVVGFVVLHDFDEIKEVVGSSSSNYQTNSQSLETTACALLELQSRLKEGYENCQNTARSFLNFALQKGNLMFLNGEEILSTKPDSQTDTKVVYTEGLSGLDKYVYEWRDSIFSTDKGFTIKTNGFHIKDDKLVESLEIMKMEYK